MSQRTAAKKGAPLLLDESGCGLAGFPSAREEGFELFADDAVEYGGFLRAPIGVDSLLEIILYRAWGLRSFYRLSSFCPIWPMT